MAVETILKRGVLGYPRTVVLDIFPDMCTIEKAAPQYKAPALCPDHLDPSGRPVCFKAEGNSLDPLRQVHCEGTSRLSSPISIPTLLPSTTSPPVRTLQRFETFGQHVVGWGTGGAQHQVTLSVLTDDTLRYNKDLSHMLERPSWFHTLIDNLNIDLSVNSKFNFELYQLASVLTGYWANHVGNGATLPCAMRFTFYYEISELPPMASLSVTVLDSVSRVGVEGVTVKVASLVGEYVAADVGGGLYTFTNIPEDNYVLSALKAGYKYIEKSILVSGTKSETFYLEYVGGEFILPDWWWIPVAAIGGLAVSYFLVKSFRAPRRAEPPIYVVR